MAEPQGTDNPVSLKDILQVIQQQGASIAALDAKISGELDGIKQDVHGSASQVKKLKTESQCNSGAFPGSGTSGNTTKKSSWLWHSDLF